MALFDALMARLAVALLAGYPLAAAFRAIPRGSVFKHAFAATAGMASVGWVTSLHHLAHVVTMVAVSYALIIACPRKLGGWAVLAYASAHTLLVHCARDGVLDALCPLVASPDSCARVHGTFHVGEYQIVVMCVTLKVAGFALSWADGGREANSLGKLHANQRVIHLPSPMRFLGYVLFFPSVLGHPAFYSYAEYESAVGDGPTLCAEQPAPPPPVDWSTVARRLAEGLAFGAVHSLAGRFKAECSEGVYLPLPCYLRSALSILKFFAFWRICDGPIVIAGLVPSSQLSTPEHFTRMRDTLFGPDLAHAVRYWNSPVARFLKVHVFARSPRSLSAGTAFLYSALWHGVAPGYFVAASSALYFMHCAQALQSARHLCPRESPSLDATWRLVGRVLTHLTGSFLFMPMMTLTGPETLAMLRGLAYAPYIGGFVLAAGATLAAIISPAPKRPQIDAQVVHKKSN